MMEIRNGDCVFFKTAKKSSKRKAAEIKFKGHGFGIFLGHVPEFQKDPPAEHLFRLMGTVGFLTFDNVGEFLGPAMAEVCIKKFEEKYWAPEKPLVELTDAKEEAKDEAPL